MKLEEVLNNNNNFVFSRRMTRRDRWIFYFIRNVTEDLKDLDSIYGFSTEETINNRTVNVYGVNLKSCYKGRYYSIRCFVETIIHETIHPIVRELIDKHMTEEEILRYAHNLGTMNLYEEFTKLMTKELMKGYRYRRVHISNE